jgi:hypothetical protein
MASLAMAYSLLTVIVGFLARADWREEPRGLGRAIRES